MQVAVNEPCLSGLGKPKKEFSTLDEAMEEAGRLKGFARPYACKKHGWHIASELSHGLTDAVSRARKAKKNGGRKGLNWLFREQAL